MIPFFGVKYHEKKEYRISEEKNRYSGDYLL
jgi:hypothetical protein